MATISAGALMCRMRDGTAEVLLVHPGGPFFAKKDDGAWSIPKGLVDDGEDLLAAARRELAEETGLVVDAEGPFVELGKVQQKGGKVVHAWAFAGDCDPAAIVSNTFEMEWPPRSGARAAFPEIDRAAFFDRETALRKILEAQRPFVERALSEETLELLFGE
jgi:predicted NUDIX family NTP pyrophosphohydrolase